MNKKLNTAYFLIAATILNLLILIILAIILGFITGQIYQRIGADSPGLSLAAVLIILFGSIGGTFFLYTRIVKWAVKKWDLEKYLDPIFRSRRSRGD